MRTWFKKMLFLNKYFSSLKIVTFCFETFYCVPTFLETGLWTCVGWTLCTQTERWTNHLMEMKLLIWIPKFVTESLVGKVIESYFSRSSSLTLEVLSHAERFGFMCGGFDISELPLPPNITEFSGISFLQLKASKNAKFSSNDNNITEDYCQISYRLFLQ